ncbi:MAG: glutamate--tRNA ligase [Candidatus Omnitrophica bacterium]|nr:glutamate--tRNA ligase [Candidatus Omnitrophota bacterium]
MSVRVRFAPSPTGFLHLGSARTALFNWLYARHTGGKFVLRVEDTDKQRSKKEFLDDILNDLKWMGVDWDEGPFFQSERFGLYKQMAEDILAKGLAYKEGEAIIFRVEKGRKIKVDDLVHGEIVVSTDEIKDQVLMKSDGSPAYNFACVVDDADLKITHIIRGDDHISNTPKQIMFYEALGVEPPKFAHIPLMMGKDGAKLSKRHCGVAVSEYKNQGFLPEALSNYLLLLGWQPEDGREIVSLKGAVKEFDVVNINKVQVRFDIDKLKWLNGEYIRAKSLEDIYLLLKEQLDNSGIERENVDEEKLKKIIGLYQVRIKTLTEFIELTDYFFKDDYLVDEKGKRKYLDKEENKENLKLALNELKHIDNFSHEKIEELYRALADKNNLKPANIIHPTRMAISGKTKGAGLFEVMELLGKEIVLKRMEKAAE